MDPRFFCPEPMVVGTTLRLPEAVAHHAFRVLRLRVGDAIVLFDGQGGEYWARLASAGREAAATIEAFEPVERESPLALTLVQALPAGDKMDWIVEKAVELGVARLIPVMAERSVVRLAGERAEKRVAHLRGVARAACEQCGRNRLPEVEPIVALGDFLARGRGAGGLCVVLAPGGRPLDAMNAPDRKVTLMVGPEGGWSAAELAAMQATGWSELALGSRILRTETAGLAALAALQARWGDFR